MKILSRRFLLIVLSLFIMTACNEQKPAPNVKTDTKTETNTKPETNTEPVKTAAENKPPKPVSNKLDACEVLPKAEVEKIIGETVKSANLSRVTEGTEATAAFSQCTYTTESGNTVEFFARRSPVADNTAEAIQKSREMMKETLKKKPEDITGIGKSAYWVGSPVSQLHVFAGDAIYVYFTMRGIKTEPEAKAKALQLAHSAIGTLSK